MFDLFRSRDKAVRIFLSGLLGLVALSMLIYLIPTSGMDPAAGNTDQAVVASVGKDQLTAQEVKKKIQGMTANRQLPSELLSIYVPQIVQQMISERAMAYEAGRLGIRVSSDEADNAILDSLPAGLVKDGKVDTATLSAVLQQQGVSMSDLKDDTTRQLLVNRLLGIVSDGVFVSPRDIEDEFHKRHDKVKIEYALLAPAAYQSEAEPSEAEIKAYYDSHKASFQTQEKRSLGIILLDPAKVNPGAVPPDSELRRDYNANLDKYRTPERVRVRHVLVKSDASNDAAMKAKAEGLLKQIQGGADFAKLAKENSEDPGSAEKGGELGFIEKGQTVPEFEKAAFTLQPGQTSGLVKTTYGYHILQVEEHQQARVQPFDEVKGQLAMNTMQRSANQEVQKLADKAVAELRKDPLHPEKAAAAVNVTVIRADNLQSGDPIPNIGVSKELMDAVAPLRKGEATLGPVPLQGNKLAIASVLDYQPAHQASLDEARTDVRNKSREEKAQKIVDQKANELLARAQSLGGDLLKAGKELKIEIKTSMEVDRQGAIESVGTATTLPDAFTKPANSLFGPVTVPGGRVVAKVVEKIPASAGDLAAQTASLRDELKQQKARERTQIFEDGVKKRLQEQGKLKIHQDVVTRLVQSYTTQRSQS